MQKWTIGLLLFVVLAVVPLAGCDESQKLTPAEMQQIAAMVDQASVVVDTGQSIAAVATTAMDPCTAVKVAKVSNEIDQVQPQVAMVSKAIASAPYSLEDDQVMLLLKAAQAGNAASTPFNPYALPISLGLLIASGVYGFFVTRAKNAKAKAAEDYALKYASMKQGTEKLRLDLLASGIPEKAKVAVQMYENIGEARTQLGVK